MAHGRKKEAQSESADWNNTSTSSKACVSGMLVEDFITLNTTSQLVSSECLDSGTSSPQGAWGACLKPKSNYCPHIVESETCVCLHREREGLNKDSSKKCLSSRYCFPSLCLKEETVLWGLFLSASLYITECTAAGGTVWIWEWTICSFFSKHDKQRKTSYTARILLHCHCLGQGREKQNTRPSSFLCTLLPSLFMLLAGVSHD